MEIDEPPTKKIREGGKKETQLSLISVIVASCLIFPINISKGNLFFIKKNLIKMRWDYVSICKRDKSLIPLAYYTLNVRSQGKQFCFPKSPLLMFPETKSSGGTLFNVSCFSDRVLQCIPIGVHCLMYHDRDTFKSTNGSPCLVE